MKYSHKSQFTPSCSYSFFCSRLGPHDNIFLHVQVLFFFFPSESVGVTEPDPMDLKLLTQCSAALAEVPEAEATCAAAFPAGSCLALEPGSSHTAGYTSAGQGDAIWAGRAAAILKGMGKTSLGSPAEGQDWPLWDFIRDTNLTCGFADIP